MKIDTKLKDLKKKIDLYNVKNNKQQNNINRSGSRLGLRLSTEIVAALIIGVGIGIVVDNYFNTKPFGLIIFFILGSLAGFLNVYRVMRQIEKQNSK